jgi:uncharacterized coiled-coil protein SlyX
MKTIEKRLAELEELNLAITEHQCEINKLQMMKKYVEEQISGKVPMDEYITDIISASCKRK